MYFIFIGYWNWNWACKSPSQGKHILTVFCCFKNIQKLF